MKCIQKFFSQNHKSHNPSIKYNSILIALIIIVMIVYFVLKYLHKLEKLLGLGGIAIIKKVFGIVLLALAIKLFRKYSGL